MKRLFAFLVVPVLFCCSCSSNPTATSSALSTASKNNIDGCYTSSCTMPQVYDKEYDPAVIGTFSVKDYEKDIETQSQFIQIAKDDQSEGVDEFLNIFNKNYGKMDSDKSVRYAAIEVFDRMNCGQYAPDEIKVYRDDKAGCWMVKNINLEFLKKVQHGVFELDGGYTVIFSDDGKLLGCWNF